MADADKENVMAAVDVTVLEQAADAIEPYASTRIVLSDKNQRAFLWTIVDRLRSAAKVTVTVTADDLRLVLLATKARRSKAVDEAWERCFAAIDNHHRDCDIDPCPDCEA